MSVQGLVNTAISTAAGAVTSEKTKEKKATKAQTAETIKTQKLETEKKQKIVRGQPSLADVQAAQQAATEQVSTRAAAINTARENMAKQREMIAQVNRADLMRELRQGGYISGRQAKRVIYNLEKGGASNGTIEH